ncbi:MAG TPA: UDP-3-O-acyl-N-acetylglucosamine deacetylase, partial [Planctomycetaceae bacterium]
VLTPETFASEIAGARTFVLESEVAALRQRGYGEKVTSADLLVFGKDGVIGNVLRADNECARHKLLDCVGDFALIGGRLAGRFAASRTGHAANRDLIRRLAAGHAGRKAA